MTSWAGGIHVTAAVIVSRANACARSARATPSGGCRRLLAAGWPLTGTISRQRSMSGGRIAMIVSGPACSSRHRPTPAAKMTANRAATGDDGHQEHTGWSLGAENFPASGGFVVCPNHISYVDVFAFAHFLYDNGHPPFFLAKAGVFKIPILGRLLTAC